MQRGVILLFLLSIQRHVCAEGKEILLKSLKNVTFLSAYDVKIPRKISHDHFKNLFQASLQFFTANILSLRGGLYILYKITQWYTHPVGWSLKSKMWRTAVFSEICTQRSLEKTKPENTVSPFLFVLHHCCISANTEVTKIFLCLFHFFTPGNKVPTKVHWQPTQKPVYYLLSLWSDPTVYIASC